MRSCRFFEQFLSDHFRILFANRSSGHFYNDCKLYVHIYISRKKRNTPCMTWFINNLVLRHPGQSGMHMVGNVSVVSSVRFILEQSGVPSLSFFKFDSS